MLTKLERRMDELSENFNKEIKKYKKEPELNNTKVKGKTDYRN